YASHNPPDPHSFPTRRSSDLQSAFHARRPSGSVHGSAATTGHRRRSWHPALAPSIFSSTTRNRPARAANGTLVVSSSPGCRHERSEEHTSELQSRSDLVCRLL